MKNLSEFSMEKMWRILRNSPWRKSGEFFKILRGEILENSPKFLLVEFFSQSLWQISGFFFHNSTPYHFKRWPTVLSNTWWILIKKLESAAHADNNSSFGKLIPKIITGWVPKVQVHWDQSRVWFIFIPLLIKRFSCCSTWRGGGCNQFPLINNHGLYH